MPVVVDANLLLALVLPLPYSDHVMLGLDSLPVRSVPTDPDLRRSALSWAERLGQFAAYDSFYVALAERLGCEVWTADRRLANAAAAIGDGLVKSLPLSDH